MLRTFSLLWASGPSSATWWVAIASASKRVVLFDGTALLLSQALYQLDSRALECISVSFSAGSIHHKDKGHPAREAFADLPGMAERWHFSLKRHNGKPCSS